MPWIVEMVAFNTGLNQEQTFLFAQGPGVALPDHVYAEPGLVSWSSPTQKVDVGQTGMVEQSGDEGEVVISNPPQALTQEGPWDALLSHVWQGRMARLYHVTGTWAGRVLAAWGVLEQPYGNIIGSGSTQGALRFALRDPRAALQAPLQGVKYLGTNVGDEGVEGGPDQKGRPKPVLYGTASNLPVPRVNESLLIYQVADRAATVLCVRDGGSGLGQGVTRATLALLQSEEPDPGKWDVHAGPAGTYVRLGSTPIYDVTVDASEGPENERSHAHIWKRLRIERCNTPAGKIHGDAFAAAVAARSEESGFWWNDEVDQIDAVNEVLSGFSGFEVLGQDESWRAVVLALPDGESTLELVMLAPGMAMGVRDRPLTQLQRVRPSYTPSGAPPYRATVRWGRNHQVMGQAQFAAGATRRIRDKFGEEWRRETATNLTIWDPEARTGLFPSAPELVVDSGFAPGPDNISCPAALAEAIRLRDMLCLLRGSYQASFVPTIGDYLLPGAVVTLRYGGMGLLYGRQFRVLQASFLLGSHGPEIDLVVGLEQQ